MKKSALLDTSFLISLSDPTRTHHLVAKDYYRYMLDAKITMFFSAIAASEFNIKQQITDLPLKTFVMLPFNIQHGVESSKLWGRVARPTGEARDALKDDLKLIGQAAKEGINFILTEDKNTMSKYCETLRAGGFAKVRAVTLADGFDISLLNDDGQMDMLSGKAATATTALTSFPAQIGA